MVPLCGNVATARHRTIETDTSDTWLGYENIGTVSSNRHWMKVGEITTRVKRRLGNRMREAFTFLVATAWMELFNDIFTYITGDSSHILARVIHAVLFTVIAVIITVTFENDSDD